MNGSRFVNEMNFILNKLKYDLKIKRNILNKEITK